jgi:hypothetical protein
MRFHVEKCCGNLDLPGNGIFAWKKVTIRMELVKRKQRIKLERESVRQRFLSMLGTVVWNDLAENGLSREERTELIRLFIQICARISNLDIEELEKTISNLQEGKTNVEKN